WMQEIRSAIAAADAVLVIVSPDSCASPVCQAELECAAELNKRLVPVRVRDTHAEALPDVLAALNLFDLGAGQDFDADVDQLAKVLDADLDGLHLHTRLTVRAHEWDSDSRDRSRLLRGRELSVAERWLLKQSARTPSPTLAQTSFLAASRAAAARRQRTLVLGAAVLVVVLAVLTSAAGIEWRSAGVQRQGAVSQRDIAASGLRARQSQAVGDANATTSKLESIAAWGIDHSAQARHAMLVAAARPQLATLTVGGGVDLVAFRPDGKALATSGSGGVQLWNLATLRPTGTKL